MLAPIVAFVYDRPIHAKKMLVSLMNNELSNDSELFIFADGPKPNAHKEQLDRITETRKIIIEEKWCGKVHIIEREKNIGLYNSITRGIQEVVDKYEKIIVLEDDLVLSKYFLKYMNDALDIYKDDDRVMQISGYMFPVELLEKKDTFFVPLTTAWGWATWKRSWNFFDSSMEGFEKLKENKEMRRRFNFNDSYPYYRILKNQMNKKFVLDIRFYLSVFMKNGLVLFPRKTLVKNIGFDGSGTHCITSIRQSEMDDNFLVNNFCSVNKSSDSEKAISVFLKSQNNIVKRFPSLVNYFFKKIKI